MLDERKETYTVEMAFINGTAIWEAANWQRRIDSVFDWVSKNIRESTQKTEQTEIKAYIATLYGKAKRVGSPYDEIIREMFKVALATMPEDIGVPRGESHGDLTFTNMIAGRDATYIIDFDKGALETPYYDFIKLEQDAVCGWYRRFSPNPTYGSHLDSYVIERLKNFKEYQRWRPLLAAIALSRILIRNKEAATKWVETKYKLFF